MASKALFLAGDSYHDPAIAFESIGKMVEAQGCQVDFTSREEDLTTDRLADKDLFIIHRDGINFPLGHDHDSVPWMQPHQEEAVEQFVLRGGSLLAFHNSAWGYPWKGGYRRVLGGYYLTHPPIARFEVLIAAPGHPVTAGVQPYEIEDEQHWLWFDYDRVTLLAYSRAADGRQSASAWAYEYGAGRVVFLANGHSVEAHAHPEFMKLKHNAVRWLLKKS